MSINSGADEHSISISRLGFNENSLTERYSYQKYKPENALRSTKNYVVKNYKPSVACAKTHLKKRLPIIDWIRRYNIRENLLKDLVGGLTIGVVSIPQGMGYSMMAGLPPVNGLYVSFFTAVIYLIFGSARHLSIGTYGIVSLMMKAVLERYEGKLYAEDEAQLSGGHRMLFPRIESIRFERADNTNYISNDPNEAKALIAMAITFLAGIFQIGFAILHAGVVTKYLSDVVVAAFTTGAAYHIVVSQINILLGIKLDHDDWPVTLIANFYEIFKRIKEVNAACVVISIISMTCLFLVKHFINHKYQHKLCAPLPIELVVIVLGTLFSFLVDFHGKWKVPIVGPIPLGFPKPNFPPTKVFSLVVVDALSIAIVSFAINISMGKLFSKKYDYPIYPNQELFAYGLGNILSSFFKGFPSCVGLSRCIILEGTGAKTLLFSAFSSTILLVVILGIGFLFKTLPNCCLASIIVIALITMLTEVRQIVPIFKRSKLEALAWLATFGGVMILDISWGLYIGIGISILLVIIQSQRATTTVLGNIPHTDIYEGVNVCDDVREIEGIKIIRYEASLFYANVENFIYKVNKISNVYPQEIQSKISKKKAEYAKKAKKLKKLQKKQGLTGAIQGVESQGQMSEIKLQVQLENEINQIYDSIKIKDIVLDCSCINLLDSMGVEALVKLNIVYSQIGVSIHLTHCKRSLFRLFDKLKFNEKFDYSYIYPTTHDAVLAILYGKRSSSLNTTISSSEQRPKPEPKPNIIFTTDSVESLDKNTGRPVYVNLKKQQLYNTFDQLAMNHNKL